MEEERSVDWDVVDESLYLIPAVYKDARFDSLKHVLTVLGAVDSEAALEEVSAEPHPDGKKRVAWSSRCIASASPARACARVCSIHSAAIAETAQ